MASSKLKRGDGAWLFLKHHSDTHSHRWMAYPRDPAGPRGYDDEPANDGLGHIRLRDAAAWALNQSASAVEQEGPR